MVNWVLYYPVEKILSKYTDILITINKEDYELATKKFLSKKVEYIPGVGLDTQKIFALRVNKDEKKSDKKLRKKMGDKNIEIVKKLI